MTALSSPFSASDIRPMRPLSRVMVSMFTRRKRIISVTASANNSPIPTVAAAPLVTILGVTYRNKAWALQLTPFEKQVRLC